MLSTVWLSEPDTLLQGVLCLVPLLCHVQQAAALAGMAGMWITPFLLGPICVGGEVLLGPIHVCLTVVMVVVPDKAID